MDIVKTQRREDVPVGAPLVEVRKQADGMFVVSVETSDQEASYLDGPFTAAASAETRGIEMVAERGPIDLLYLVTPGD